jgi:prepilin-type N-terminal cleavage/methylation domain-containing protein
LKKAFTLVELLTVTAILAVLAALLFPVFASARVAAKATETLSNYRQFAIAFSLYCGDADEAVVPNSPGMKDLAGRWTSWKQILLPLVKNQNVYRDALNPAAAFLDPISDPERRHNPPDLVARPGFYRGYYYYFPFFKTGHLSHNDEGPIGAMPTFSLSSVYDPSRAIAFSEAKENFVDIGPWIPFRWRGANGWQVPNWGGGKRDDKGMTLAFVDGHAKFTPLRRTCEGEAGVENMWQWDRRNTSYTLTNGEGTTSLQDIAWVDTLCQTLPF